MDLLIFYTKCKLNMNLAVIEHNIKSSITLKLFFHLFSFELHFTKMFIKLVGETKEPGREVIVSDRLEVRETQTTAGEQRKIYILVANWFLK